MSKFGYITDVEQSFRNNKGIFTPQEIIELDQENKWTNFGQLELIQTQSASDVNNLEKIFIMFILLQFQIFTQQVAQ